jgi:hypothetical protein
MSAQAPGRVPLRDLVEMLAASFGKEKATEIVKGYAHDLGIAGDTCSSEEALTMLESMAKANGLLGIVARFAKARWLLSRGAS